MAIFRDIRIIDGGSPLQDTKGGLPLAISVLGHIALLAAFSLGGFSDEGFATQGKGIMRVTLSSATSLTSVNNSAIVKRVTKAKTLAPATERIKSKAPPETHANQAADTNLAKSLNAIAGRQGQGEHGLKVSMVSANIKRIIQSSVTYPTIARRRGIQGALVAAFSLDTAGMPHEVRIVKSSGSRLLDNEALRVIKKASPYPTIERNIPNIEVPVTFSLITQ